MYFSCSPHWLNCRTIRWVIYCIESTLCFSVIFRRNWLFSCSSLDVLAPECNFTVADSIVISLFADIWQILLDVDEKKELRFLKYTEIFQFVNLRQKYPHMHINYFFLMFVTWSFNLYLFLLCWHIFILFFFQTCFFQWTMQVGQDVQVRATEKLLMPGTY